MQLNEVQHDALVELLNIGFGRAGASLSRLTGHRVLLEVPQVSIHPITQLHGFLEQVVEDEVASVHQIFSGPVAGDALLMLDPIAASALKELLTSEPALPLALDASTREVLTEVGNILLNACLGTFGNLLHMQIGFSVPSINVATVKSVLGSLESGQDGFRYALVVTAGFRLRGAEVTGYVVIILSVQSLSRLLGAVDEWERRQRLM
jgi:chemotaxis protein CheC